MYKIFKHWIKQCIDPDYFEGCTDDEMIYHRLRKSVVKSILPWKYYLIVAFLAILIALMFAGVVNVILGKVWWGRIIFIYIWFVLTMFLFILGLSFEDFSNALTLEPYYPKMKKCILLFESYDTEVLSSVQEMNDVDTKYVQHNMVLPGLLGALLVALITLIGQVSSYIITVVGAVIFFLALLSYALHIRGLEVNTIITQSINEIKVRRSIKEKRRSIEEKRQRQEVRQYLDNCFLERLLSESL